MTEPLPPQDPIPGATDAAASPPSPPSPPTPSTPAVLPAPGPGRGLRLALVISLAVNLAVLGLALGAALHRGPFGGGAEMVRELGFGPFTEALSPDDRLALRHAFRAQAPNFHHERRQMQADLSAVLAALRGAPFQPQALEAALATMQMHMTGRMDLGRSLLGAFIAQMPPEARLAFADRLEASLARGSGRD